MAPLSARSAKAWAFVFPSQAWLLILVLPLAYHGMIDVPLMSGDSQGYIDWDPTRTPAYPAFLWLLHILAADWQLLPLVQGAGFVAASLFLGRCLGRAADRPRLGMTLTALILACPPFWKWTGQIRPEPLFIAGCCVFLGASARALAGHGRRWAAATGAALAVTILLRPVAYAFLPGFGLLAILLQWHQGWRSALALVASCFVPLVAVATLNGSLRGYYSLQAFGGLTLFGQVAPLIPPEGFGDPLSARLGQRLAPLHEAIRATGGENLYWVSRQSYNAVLWGTLVPMLKDDGLDTLAGNAAAWALSRQAVTADPMNYGRIVLTHLHGMWTWRWITTEHLAASSLRLVTTGDLGRLLGPYAKLSDLKTLPEPAYAAKLAIGAGAFVLCLLVPLASLRRRCADPVLNLGALAAIHVHAYALMVAAVQPAQDRYAYVILPFLYVVGAAMIHGYAMPAPVAPKATGVVRDGRAP
jgi:hypothetical protein